MIKTKAKVNVVWFKVKKILNFIIIKNLIQEELSQEKLKIIKFKNKNRYIFIRIE